MIINDKISKTVTLADCLPCVETYSDYLNRVADDQESARRCSTAEDYRAAARLVAELEALLNAFSCVKWSALPEAVRDTLEDVRAAAASAQSELNQAQS